MNDKSHFSLFTFLAFNENVYNTMINILNLFHFQGDVGHPGLPGSLGSQGQEVCNSLLSELNCQ